MIENLGDLKYFMEVAKTQNITRAAERLGVTQPSLTLALQRLEGQLGTVLFERSRKGVLLTRSGEKLFLRAGQMLEDWEREMRLIAQTSVEPSGRYTLGIHVSVAQYMLASFIPKLVAKYPALEFELVHDLSRRITEKVISRQCDFGLVINPVKHPDLIIRRLLNDEVTVFSLKDYNGDVLIYDPDLKQSQQLLNNVRKVFPYKRELHSSSLEVIRQLAAEGVGAAILPSRVAQAESRLQPMKNAPRFKDELSLIYRVERRKEESLKKIFEEIT